MRERILLIGPPGSGKSYQLIKVCQFLQSFNLRMYAIDLEDKLGATLENMGGIPDNMQLYTALSWEEYKEAGSKIENEAKIGEWIAIDRIDLSWPAVQRWFTQQKYQEELADRLLKKSKEMTKPSMFVPEFDKGGWQVINEQYESVFLKIVYKLRCNILLTAGIKGVDRDSPQDIFGNLGVAPRGQKELGHQPHSVFLLHQKKSAREMVWQITTAKDLPNREYFEAEPLWDFGIQYLAGVAGLII